MRGLSDKEYAEFEKTFDFINFYIGSAFHFGAKNINHIRFDEKQCPYQLVNFIREKFNNDLKVVNRIFNEKTLQHKKDVIQRLIKYCFENRIQPKDMRVFCFKKYEVLKNSYTSVDYVPSYNACIPDCV